MSVEFRIGFFAVGGLCLSLGLSLLFHGRVSDLPCVAQDVVDDSLWLLHSHCKSNHNNDQTTTTAATHQDLLGEHNTIDRVVRNASGGRTSSLFVLVNDLVLVVAVVIRKNYLHERYK